VGVQSPLERVGKWGGAKRASVSDRSQKRELAPGSRVGRQRLRAMLCGPTVSPERETVTEEEDRPACGHERLDS